MSTPKPKKNTTATTITSSSRLTEVLTAPSLKVSPLMTAVLVFLTHTFFNAMLLSPWNSIRCTFWNQETCSSDVGWILNWFSFSHFHVALLLGCLSASSLGHAWMETKIAYLSSAVLLSFLSQGIFSLKYLNPPMAVFQAGIFGTLLVVINFWIQQDEINIPGSVYLATPFRSRSLSVSQRQKIAIPTLTLWIQLMLSIFRVVDMTFGDGKNGYMGDSSSELYQNISNMALCDMLIVVVIVAFALCYCSVEQHQALLRGQVLALFFSAHLLGSSQGEMIQPSQLKAGMIGTFVSILLAVVGALNTSYSFLSTASGRTKGRSSQRGFLSQFFIIVLLCSSVRQVGGTKPNDAGRKVTNSGSVYVQDLKEWIKARCGSDDEDGTADGVALWVYEGALWDPLEGRKVANVEGIEIVREISSVGDSRNPENKKKYRNECGELEVGPLISHPNATFDHASTILSRKLFCYKAPDSSRKQQQQLLQSIKVRPNAPTRRIPTKQAVAVYETATTFIARGKELIAHTEWPDRQSIWGRATRNSPPSSDEYDSNGKNFDFTIYARQKSANKKKEQLFDLTQEPVADTEDPAHIISSPKRSKLIEFGTSSSTGKDKFGAREAYSYNIQGLSGSGDGMLQRMGLNRVSVNDRACTVRYTRYGEGPPFFGPGRICSLELQGRRISSLDEMPPLIRSLIANRMSPQFLSSYKDTAPEDRKQILRKFHSPKGSVLQVQPAEDEPSEFWLPTYLKEHGQVYWNKLQQKLTIAELGR